MQNQTWRPERAVGIADALEALLNRIEHDMHHDPVMAPAGLLPYSTGLVALDRVCDGGLFSGTVTLLECGLASHTRALIYSAARGTDVPTLLAVERVDEATRWLLAGAAGVPEGLIRELQLSEADWAAMAGAFSDLAHRELTLSEAPSLPGLGHLLKQGRHPVVIVDDPARLGPVDEVVKSLVHLAHSTGVAVLTTAPRALELSPWLADSLARVTVAPHTLGSGAALVTTGGPEGLSVAQVQIEMLTAVAS